MMRKKGQSDTFKLLIAAVVAMAILAIVASILNQVQGIDLQCVGNPIEELTTTIIDAQGGIKASSGTICLSTGESFYDVSLSSKVQSVRTITFDCLGDASICSGPNAPVKVSSDNVEALSDVQFDTLIQCTKLTDGTGDYTCTVSVKSPNA